MKLSLAWIFDHIDADWRKVDVQQLMIRFNQMVAEIEGFTKIHTNLEPLTMVKITACDADKTIGFSKEWQKECVLSARKGVEVDQLYLVKKDESGTRWANAQDLGSGKDMLMPALHMQAHDVAGNWKTNFEAHDYILEVDNKSITHRPDMWGHRGFAREVAALLDLPFKPLDTFLATQKVISFDDAAPATTTNPFAIKIEAPQACKRIAGTYITDVKNQPSSLWMAHRLARVDARAIDGIVDITNYVMLEIGQPMHAFDADTFGEKQLIARMACNKEKLTLLDGETVELTSEDLVLTDGSKPLGLAGVMGGAHSGVSAKTTSLLVEAACFDAATIRKTAARYKKRTEASSRFEKTLDPNQNVTAIQRFLKLCDDMHIACNKTDALFSLGKPAAQEILTISHEMIEKRLGVTIAPDFVIHLLTRLDFGIKLNDGLYTITVPTFRSSKDVRIKEDIIEEVGRYYGYTTLETYLPALQLKPAQDIGWVYRQRAIKQLLANSCAAKELYTYAFFDEEFIAQLRYNPTNMLEVQSPVSENWRRLVTSLVPNLLKSVATNSAEHDSLRFFELARTWHHGSTIVEKKSLTGIFYHKKEMNFYNGKAELQKLFDMLNLDVKWAKIEQSESPWYAPYETADLLYNDTKIGIAGKVHPTFLSSVCIGDAFIFELDADFLLSVKSQEEKFTSISKYPEMVRDISMLASVEITAAQIADLIAHTNAHITAVTLLDFFEKDEWPGKRAMTFRFVITNNEKTMTKEEADTIWDAVASNLKQVGATIR